MPHFHLTEATLYHLHGVLTDLRKEDEEEISVLGFPDPASKIQMLVDAGSHMWAWVDGSGEAVAIFGVTADKGFPGAGRVWMLIREGVKAPRKMYLKDARKALDTMAEMFPVLFNWKWMGNQHHLPWLERLGFVPIRTLALNGKPFIEIVRTSG